MPRRQDEEFVDLTRSEPLDCRGRKSREEDGRVRHGHPVSKPLMSPQSPRSFLLDEGLKDATTSPVQSLVLGRFLSEEDQGLLKEHQT